MTVIEKLENNIAEVNSAFQNIKTKIVESGVEVSAELRPSEYAPKVGEVYEAGKKAEYDAFWDDFMSVQSYSVGVGSFCGRGWHKKTFRPNLDLVMKGNANYSFYNNGYEGDLVELCSNLGITTNLKPTSLNSAFRYAFFTRLPVIDLTKCTSMELAFADCRYLTTIDKLIFGDVTKTLSSSFYNSANLENLSIEGVISVNGFDVRYSTKLSKASITSIVNALSSTTSGLTVTLSKTAVNTAFETSAGAADGSTSAEWQSLIAPKSNWTISLV